MATRLRSMADVVDRDLLFWNLRRFGAPLVKKGVPGEKLTLEMTLAHALVLARHRADVARVWPVVFSKNRADLDLSLLVSTAKSLREERALGLFLSVVRALENDQSVTDTEGRLLDEMTGNDEYFFLMPCGERLLELEKRRTPEFARKWSFWMNATMEWFEGCFRKHINAPV